MVDLNKELEATRVGPPIEPPSTKLSVASGTMDFVWGPAEPQHSVVKIPSESNPPDYTVRGVEMIKKYSYNIGDKVWYVSGEDRGRWGVVTGIQEKHQKVLYVVLLSNGETITSE